MTTSPGRDGPRIRQRSPVRRDGKSLEYHTCGPGPSTRTGSPMANSRNDFQLEWHGNTVVVIPAANVESMNWDLIEEAAEIVMEPLREQKTPMVVVDLSDVGYFGSVFLALLLRCHKFVRSRGGELVLCGASKMAAELLRIS